MHQIFFEPCLFQSSSVVSNPSLKTGLKPAVMAYTCLHHWFFSYLHPRAAAWEIIFWRQSPHECTFQCWAAVCQTHRNKGGLRSEMRSCCTCANFCWLLSLLHWDVGMLRWAAFCRCVVSRAAALRCCCEAEPLQLNSRPVNHTLR